MSLKITRRQVVQAGVALGASAVFSPPVLTFAQGETPIKIGMHDPLTGTYAAEGESEVRGARMALAEINAKGGILGRKLELAVEDDNANAGLAAQKAHKLIEQEKVALLMGAVSSATALSVNQVAHDKGIVYMVTGGHTDPVTGSQCHWTTFRICTTTYMLAAGLAETLYKKFGGKWYFITPDYAFGHTLQESYAKLLGQMGGTVLGNSLSPLGTTDFTAYLIKAQQSHPDVLINLCDGQESGELDEAGGAIRTDEAVSDRRRLERARSIGRAADGGQGWLVDTRMVVGSTEHTPCQGLGRQLSKDVQRQDVS